MYRLGHIPNCNFRNRFNQWEAAGGTLRKNKNIGCGLNSLAFLDIFTRQQGEALVDVIDAKGTTFLQMMSYVYRSMGVDVKIVERNIPIRTEVEVQQFLDTLLQDLPDNSCTVAKMMRYPDTGPPVDCNGKNLTSGHSIVFSKNGNQITAIDPQQMSVRENINASSSFKAWQKNCYISISLIYGFSGNIKAMQYPEQEDVDMTDAYQLEYNSPQMAARAASPQMIARAASPQMIARAASPRIAARPASSRPSQFEMSRLPTISRRLYQPLYQPVSPIPKSNKSSSLPYYKPLLRRGYNQPLYNQLDIGIEPLGYISQIPLSDKVSSSRPYQTDIKERPDINSRSESPASKRSLARLELLTREEAREDQEEKTRNKRCIGSNCVLMFGAKSHKALKSARKSRKAHKSARKTRKSLRKSRKSLRKSRKARKSARKTRKALKSARKSRKARKSLRKSRKAHKSTRKSRKSTQKSRKARKSTQKSRKARK